MTTTSGDAGHLFHNLILFGRLLHGLGLDVNPGRMVDVIQALGHVNVARRPDFYFTLRALLVTRQEDLALFDQAFDRFWRRPLDEGIDFPMGELFRRPDTSQPIIAPPALADEPPAGDEEEDEDEEIQEVIEVTVTYSAREVLRRKDFADLTPDELHEIRRLMARLIWQIGRRRTRRMRAGRGRRLDFRRTLRRNFRYGGELLDWSTLRRKYKPRPLIIIADISGSMERYTRLLIHFLYGLAEGLNQRVEVFVFSTRLTRITRQLRQRDVDRALYEVAHAVPDWSGGTRIGEALKDFNFNWGRRVLRGGAIVLLISDGWDRGDPLLLDREIARLQRNCDRLVWLNPLLGATEYEPLTRGMVAALPHIDDFLPVHNLASLEALAEHLEALQDERAAPGRRTRLSGASFIGQ